MGRLTLHVCAGTAREAGPGQQGLGGSTWRHCEGSPPGT